MMTEHRKWGYNMNKTSKAQARTHSTDNDGWINEAKVGTFLQ